MFNIQVWNSTSVTENKEHQNRLPLKKNHIYMVVSLQDILAILLTATAVPVHFYPRVSNAACCKDTLKEFLSFKAIKEE